MKNQTPEEIREKFNIKNDFSSAEEFEGYVNKVTNKRNFFENSNNFHFQINLVYFKYSEEMELLDMNNDCWEHVLKFCDADSLVAALQTCKRLNEIATALFKHKTSYICSIDTEEVECRVKRTIGAIGKFLIELKCRPSYFYQLGGVFYDFLTQNCPKLQKLEISCRVCPNTIFDSIVN